MKRTSSLAAVMLVTGAILPFSTFARVVTVTTANNANPPSGQVSLKQALTGLQDGDIVQFNIPNPGGGPITISTPSGGYPLITANNVLIDGYSQPGAKPNTNPILAPNNAKLMIVLDSSNGNFASMNFEPDNGKSGYGDTEFAILGVLRATNVNIRGLSLLGKVPAPGDNSNYGISFACDATGKPSGAHVNGCWIGVAPDGKTLSGTSYAITGFRWRDPDGNNPVTTDDITIGVGKNSTNAPAEFNVIVQAAIPIIIEGGGLRISGNFIGVLPDGVTEYNVAFDPAYTGDFQFEGAIEIGRNGNNVVIGTDGDGVNDANERNIICGTLPPDKNGYDHTIEFYGNVADAKIVIAGNYIGVGVDGQTYFTNGVPAINASGGTAQYRIGSNLDGVSDDLEGNLIVNNWPLDLFPAGDWVSNGAALNFFDEISLGAIVSLRGNSLINNFPHPVSPLKGDAGEDGLWRTNFYAKAVTDLANGIVPVLSTNTTISRLLGTVPLADTNTWPATVIDLYAADPLGITNGMNAGINGMPFGFVQGGRYAASFADNGPADRDKRPGYFDIDISTVDTKGSLLTVTANYVKANNEAVLTSPFSDPVEITFLPGSIESVGLRRIVPDTPVILPPADALGNWEPYASVLGTSTFLVECNTFADNDASNQRYVVALQPAAGGAMALAEGFFADDGKPYKAQINASRQNGNPGRVAGDKRPGADTFMVGGEASPHAFPTLFGADNRWNLGFDRLADGRYGTVQTFRLNPATLVQAPLSKALDSANGRLTSGAAPDPQISRFGGDIVCLDNGNFVSVVEDRSRVRYANGHATAATIFAPDGGIVRETFLVAPQAPSTATGDYDIWANVAAYKGGFAVRAKNAAGNGRALYFFDNAGNLKGTAEQSTSGESYDNNRGDGTRIAAHINSPYVYLIGKVANENFVRVSVWDSRDQSFQAKADVSEGAFTGGFDRANIAVDALNRFVGTWVSQPAGYSQQQVAARVMSFNPATKTITALTRSFLPFVNNASNDVRTLQMSPAITTKQILVAAKGEINLQNNPAAGPNSPREINFYTVFTHPSPAEDPTASVGGDAPRFTRISVIPGNPAKVRVEWTGGGTLQVTDDVTKGQWQDVTGATSPFEAAIDEARLFARIKR